VLIFNVGGENLRPLHEGQHSRVIKKEEDDIITPLNSSIFNLQLTYFTSANFPVSTCPPAVIRTTYTPLGMPDALKLTLWRPADIT
jgi:hypothetical protein